MESWNGVSLFWKSRKDKPDVEVWSDAPLKWGCGAIAKDEWLQHEWPADMKPCCIVVKELIPIVMAAMVWG